MCGLKHLGFKHRDNLCHQHQLVQCLHNKENAVPPSSPRHRYTTFSPAFGLHKQERMLSASSWVATTAGNRQRLEDVIYVNLFIFQLIFQLESLISLSCLCISLPLQTSPPYSLVHKPATTAHTAELTTPEGDPSFSFNGPISLFYLQNMRSRHISSCKKMHRK